MASPFTPGKRSGTKGAAGGITTRGRGEGCLKWCSSRMGGDIIYVGLTHTCISELSCIELSYLAVLCCPQAALSLLMDASLCPHDSLILDWIIVEFRFELTENKKLDPHHQSCCGERRKYLLLNRSSPWFLPVLTAYAFIPHNTFFDLEIVQHAVCSVMSVAPIFREAKPSWPVKWWWPRWGFGRPIKGGWLVYPGYLWMPLTGHYSPYLLPAPLGPPTFFHGCSSPSAPWYQSN